MCEKTFHKYINELVAQGIIMTGLSKTGQRTFSLADKKSQTETLSVELCVKMIQFIRANLGPLPFDSQLKAITDKLENAVIHSLSGSSLAYLGNEEQIQEQRSEVYQNVGLSYKLFSNFDYDVEKQQEKMLDILQQACENLSFAEIHLKGGKKPIRHYCLFIMCHILLNRWYLVIKTPKVNRGFGLIRVDKISKLNFPENIHTSASMLKSIKKAKEDAMREIVGSFGMGLGDKIQIKLLLSSDREISENAMAWLDEFIVCKTTQQDGTSMITVEIDGVSDFMHWLRGYGSHILILEPEYLRSFQLDEMEQLIRKYQEVKP
ncbi:MAG: WYL domain-containing protein [Ruminiclostridium sp.]|nr:WYL domain-containing protein [Ruminiclostridium sp.]